MAAKPDDLVAMLRGHHQQALERLDAWIANEVHLMAHLLRQHPPAEADVGAGAGALCRGAAEGGDPRSVAAVAALRHDELPRQPAKCEGLLPAAEMEENLSPKEVTDEDQKPGPSAVSWDGDLDVHWLEPESPQHDQEPWGDHTADGLPAGSRIHGALRRTVHPSEGVSSEASISPHRGQHSQDFDAEQDQDKMWFFAPADQEDELMQSVNTHFVQESVRRTGSGFHRSSSQLALQGKINRLVTSYKFEMLSASAICLNSLLIGIEVETMAATSSAKVPLAMSIADYAFTAFFATELVLRLLAEEACNCVCRQRGWIVFDSFLVLSSLVELVVGFLTDVSDASNIMSARIIRILRITRMIRVLRFVRVVRFVRALRVMVHSIANTLKSVIWAVVLLFMVIYFFGILFTQAASEQLMLNCSEPGLIDPACGGFSKAAELARYWGDLGTSMLTLLESVIGGMDWDLAMKPLGHLHWFWLLSFVGFILFTYFAILNVVTAAFCQGALEGQQYDREQTVKDLLSNKQSDLYKTSDLFRNMFSKIDSDASGDITWKEFQAHITDDSVQALLALLELENQDLWVLFRLLDTDGSQKLDAHEFVTGCMRLRGSARSIDLAKVSFENHRLSKRLISFMRFLKVEVVELRRQVELVGRRTECSPDVKTLTFV